MTEDYHIPLAYPPKFPLEEAESKPPLIKGVYSIVLYLGIGYLLLRRWDLLLLIFGVALLHEAGHFLAMKYYRYADVGIFFLPFIGAFVQGSKKNISQRQSTVILLAGPVPGLLLGMVLHFIDGSGNMHIGQIPVQLIAQLLIWANLLNLLPIYPLDGGQLFNRVYLNEEGILSTVFITLSAAFVVWVAISLKFYILLALPVLFILRFVNTRSHVKLEKEIEHSGIYLNTTYKELNDEDYWEIRKILIKHIPVLQQLQPGPPYIYSSKEERVAQEVEHVLQRNLLMDIPTPGKIILALIWAILIMLPWLLGINFLLLKYFIH